MQVRISISQEPDFERLDQILDVASIGEHGRNHHQCARLGSNAGGEIHSRQRVRRHQQRRQPVHQRHRQLTACQQGKRDDQCQDLPIYSGGLGICHEARGDHPHDEDDGAEIDRQWEPFSDSSPSPDYGNLDRSGTFQLGKPLVEQIEADMCRPMIAPFAGNASSSQFDRLVGHLRFFEATLLGDALDRVPITVPGRKLHRTIGT